MSGDPNRDAAIRYTDEQARQEQIAERAHEIAERMAADKLSTVKGCRDLVLDREPHIWVALHNIVRSAGVAMDKWAVAEPKPKGGSHITSVLRACLEIAKTMHDCAMDAVQDDADEEAERELGEDG